MSVRDNVIELRKIRHADTLVERIIHGAAAEIERLRDEAERFRVERDAARREVCRDEACRPSPSPPCTARQVAMQRGWDCFKEDDA
jgi:hypothetical protein